MNVLVRDARPDDRAAIEAVTLAAYTEYAAPMRELWDLYRANIVSTLADVEPAEQLVAEADGVVLGAVLLYPAGHVVTIPDGSQLALRAPEIRLLAVAPAARGRGVGAALVRECVRRARLAGAAEVTLHTTDLMRAARRLYERHGFVRAPELDFQPAPGVTARGYQCDTAPGRGDTCST
jgi:predicted N-acetyltransferase YhbS